MLPWCSPLRSGARISSRRGRRVVEVRLGYTRRNAQFDNTALGYSRSIKKGPSTIIPRACNMRDNKAVLSPDKGCPRRACRGSPQRRAWARNICQRSTRTARCRESRGCSASPWLRSTSSPWYPWTAASRSAATNPCTTTSFARSRTLRREVMAANARLDTTTWKHAATRPPLVRWTSGSTCFSKRPLIARRRPIQSVTAFFYSNDGDRDFRERSISWILREYREESRRSRSIKSRPPRETVIDRGSAGLPRDFSFGTVVSDFGSGQYVNQNGVVLSVGNFGIENGAGKRLLLYELLLSPYCSRFITNISRILIVQKQRIADNV